MAGPVEIRGVFTGSWHETLHAIVYEHIYENTSKLAIRAESFPTLPLPLARRASIVSGVQAIWRKRAGEFAMLQSHGLTKHLCVKMMHCVPAGVSYRPFRNKVCRRYLCCPFCFYRRVDGLADRLLMQLKENCKLMVLVHPIYPKEVPDFQCVLASRSLLRNISWFENFQGGVSFRYLAEDAAERWCLVTVIVGMLPLGQALQNPLELKWHQYPATEAGIRSVLTQHIRYPTAVLREVPNAEIWNSLIGSLKHMRSGDLTKRSRTNVHNLQRPAHTTADLGIEARSELGQLLQLRPSRELQPSPSL